MQCIVIFIHTSYLKIKQCHVKKRMKEWVWDRWKEEVEKQIVKYREEKKSNALMEEWEEHGSGNDLTPPQRQKYYIREGLQWQGYLS